MDPYHQSLKKKPGSDNGSVSRRYCSPPTASVVFRKGIFNLLNRGMVPAGTDVGVVFRAGHGVLQQVRPTFPSLSCS